MLSTKLFSSQFQYSLMVEIYMLECNRKNGQSRANLSVIVLALPWVQEQALQMIDLREAVRIETGRREQMDKNKANAIGAHFSKHRPHLHVSQALFAQNDDFMRVQPNGPRSRWMSEWRDILRRKSKMILLIINVVVLVLTAEEWRYSSSGARSR